MHYSKEIRKHAISFVRKSDGGSPFNYYKYGGFGYIFFGRPKMRSRLLPFRMNGIVWCSRVRARNEPGRSGAERGGRRPGRGWTISSWASWGCASGSWPCRAGRWARCGGSAGGTTGTTSSAAAAACNTGPSTSHAARTCLL